MEDQNKERLSPTKIFYHEERLKQFLETGDCVPIHMTVGLAGYCNHKCHWCTVDHILELRLEEKLKVQMDPKTIVKFLSEAHEEGLKAITHVGSGEPLLHPKAGEIIDEIGKIGLSQGIFTNGSRLLENADSLLRNMDFVRLSLDTATSDRHQDLHGAPKGHFEKAIRGLEYLVKNRKGKFPILGAQIVTSQYNLDQTRDAVMLAKGIGLNYIAFKPMMKNYLNPTHDMNALEMNDELVAHFKSLADLSSEDFRVYTKELQFKELLGRYWNDGLDYNVCLAHRFTPYLDSDGTLQLCVGHAGEAEHVFGNIYEQSFKEIWKSDKRQKVIDAIDLHKCRSACREDPLNKVLWGLTKDEAEKRISAAGIPNPEINPNFV